MAAAVSAKPGNPDRWVNAVITVRVPLDVSVTASPVAKQTAALNVEERVCDLEGCGEVGAGITVGFEDVDDSESLTVGKRRSVKP